MKPHDLRREMICHASKGWLSLGTGVFMFLLCSPSMSGAKIESQVSRLEKATVQFYTTDDDKDGDTAVWILVRRDNGEIVAKNQDKIVGYFPNQSWSAEYPIKVAAYANHGQSVNGTTTILISPNGHDTWKFDYKITLYFDGNAPHEKQYPGVVLSEADREKTFSLSQ